MKKNCDECGKEFDTEVTGDDADICQECDFALYGEDDGE